MVRVERRRRRKVEGGGLTFITSFLLYCTLAYRTTLALDPIFSSCVIKTPGWGYLKGSKKRRQDVGFDGFQVYTYLELMLSLSYGRDVSTFVFFCDPASKISIC